MGVLRADIEGVTVVTYREEPPRDISIATRLGVRDKPDPHSFGCRATPTVTAGPPPSCSQPPSRPPRRSSPSKDHRDSLQCVVTIKG